MYIRTDKLDHPVRCDAAFLHSEHPSRHVNKHFIEAFLPYELEPMSILRGLTHGGCLKKLLVESGAVLTVVDGGLLDLVEYGWDSRSQRLNVKVLGHGL